jgi:hypothetical protein
MRTLVRNARTRARYSALVEPAYEYLARRYAVDHLDQRFHAPGTTPVFRGDTRKKGGEIVP